MPLYKYLEFWPDRINTAVKSKHTNQSQITTLETETVDRKTWDSSETVQNDTEYENETVREAIRW